MTKLLDNKIALITGGAVRIGRAALIFAREGAKIVIADILTLEGEQTARLVWQNDSKAGEVAAWLCSDASSFVTGHSLVVDGGMIVI